MRSRPLSTARSKSPPRSATPSTSMAASAATFSTTSSAMWMRPLMSGVGRAGSPASRGRDVSGRAGAKRGAVPPEPGGLGAPETPGEPGDTDGPEGPVSPAGARGGPSPRGANGAGPVGAGWFSAMKSVNCASSSQPRHPGRDVKRRDVAGRFPASGMMQGTRPPRRSPMKYRTLGRTGLKVSPLCLGTMMFGGWGNPDHDDSGAIIHAAIDGGVNFIDTADVYSGGESEEILGKAIAGRRDDLVIATKFHAPMGSDPNRAGNSRRWIMRAVEDSLRRLGTDYIDLYQVHRPEPGTDIDETL